MTGPSHHEGVGWIARAVCRGLDPGLFYPEPDDPDTAEAAKAVCAGCPVAGPCLEDALARREKHGIWGGLDEHERRLVLRRRRQAAGPARCTVEGCERPARTPRTGGMCAAHYARWQRTGTLGPAAIGDRDRKTCELDGCDEPHQARGMCGLHYNRWYRRGNPGAPGAVA